MSRTRRRKRTERLQSLLANRLFRALHEPCYQTAYVCISYVLYVFSRARARAHVRTHTQSIFCTKGKERKRDEETGVSVNVNARSCSCSCSCSRARILNAILRRSDNQCGGTQSRCIGGIRSYVTRGFPIFSSLHFATSLSYYFLRFGLAFFFIFLTFLPFLPFLPSFPPFFHCVFFSPFRSIASHRISTGRPRRLCVYTFYGR